jgi:hypothetical protein
MNIHEPLPRAAAVYVDFNQDFMHSRTGSIGMTVLVPLSISISISNRKIDIVEQGLSISIRKIDIVEQYLDTSLKILGVTFCSNLSAPGYVRRVVSDSAKSLYALRVLR